VRGLWPLVLQPRLARRSVRLLEFQGCSGRGSCFLAALLSLDAGGCPVENSPMNEPLTREEIEELARFNAEVHRGIVHTDQWNAFMADLQKRFDRAGWMSNSGQIWKSNSRQVGRA